MTSSRNFNRIALIFVGLLLLLPSVISPAKAQAPVVYGVFFYSPTCPHCHDVITNHWPGIQAVFGDQLQVLFIDVSTREGGQIMRTAVQAMKIDSNGVPMLIIGREVLVGSFDIPQYAPYIIRAGLDSGGVAFPPIPNIESSFQAVMADVPTAQVGIVQGSQFDDPANIAAVIVLLGSIGAIGMTAIAGWQRVYRRAQQPSAITSGVIGRWMALIGVVVGAGLAASLVLGSRENLSTLLISISALVVFLVLGVHLFRATSITQLASWLTPLMIAAGLLVASYLAHIEMTQVEATCGIVGNCNVVNQSEYAKFLGIPVAVIGIVGYLTMLSLWLLGRFTNQPWIDATRFIAVLVGVGFSAYLTFLEPFVIGESCVWCLTSAVVMVILLWMTAPAGLDALFPALRLDPRKRSAA